MFCPRCGSVFPDDARFCQRCGTPLEQQGTASIDLNKGTISSETINLDKTPNGSDSINANKNPNSCESPLNDYESGGSYDKNASPYSQYQENAQDRQNAQYQQYSQYQYAQNQPNAQYRQYSQYQQAGSLAQLNTYLLHNILSVVFCFGILNIPAMIGIVYAIMALSAKNRGDSRAERYARIAKNMFWVSILFSIIFFVSVLILNVNGVLNGGFFSYENLSEIEKAVNAARESSKDGPVATPGAGWN